VGRRLRRAAIPLALVAAAVGLGVLVFAPARASSGAELTIAQPKALPGSLLAASAPRTRAAQLQLGRTLFEESCSSCHGVDASGSALAPNLQGLGAATVDLWVSSGWMPLANPTSQPVVKPNKFDRAQTVAIANWVGSLAGGPPIPHPDLAGASVSQGMSIFALNCAPCHTITGAGDALSNGIKAPSLHYESATMINEAIRTGPGNMPRFGSGTLSNRQVLDVIAYVRKYIQHPQTGGFDLGGVGPVAEGFIGLFVGVGACVLAAFWIGDRTPREAEDAHGEDAAHHSGTPGTSEHV
jgi:ubiquinol-cytochrome c reductase cytochrome c subunit